MAVVLELCTELGIPAEVRRGAVAELLEPDEVLLAGNVRGTAAVVELDGQPLAPGPVTARLAAAFKSSGSSARTRADQRTRRPGPHRHVFARGG